MKQFKYLGTIFHEDVFYTYQKVRSITRCKVYDAPIKYRVSQARKCLATWIRRCKTWMLDPDMMITTFKTGVMPVLEYGVGLGGVGCVRKNDEWKGVQDYWMSVARYILHAPVRSQFAPVWGDLNWLPFSIRAGYQAAQYWMRVSKLDESFVPS